MNRKKTYYIFFYIIILFAISSCENKLKEINAFNSNENLPDITVKNLYSTYSTEAKIKIKLSAPLAYKYTNTTEPYFKFPNGFKILFYDNNGKLTSSLKADYGIYYEKKKMAKAEKNVLLTNEDGAKLTTEQLLFDEKINKIFSVKPVKIIDKDSSVIFGKGGFESNTAFTVYRFDDVSGIQNVKEALSEDADTITN